MLISWYTYLRFVDILTYLKLVMQARSNFAPIYGTRSQFKLCEGTFCIWAIVIRSPEAFETMWSQEVPAHQFKSISLSQVPRLGSLALWLLITNGNVLAMLILTTLCQLSPKMSREARYGVEIV